MAKFKVYHTKSWALNSDLHFIGNKEACKKLCPHFATGYMPVRENYELVAEATCERMGHIFELTNHIDRPWWENEGISLVKESRSTSVGDLVENERGFLFMVASVGFIEVQWSDRDGGIMYKRRGGSDSYLIQV